MQDIVGNDQLTSASVAVPNDLALDYTAYRDDLEAENISEDKKRELLETLWNIMRLFVECGFSIDVSGRATLEIFNHAARGNKKDEA